MKIIVKIQSLMPGDKLQEVNSSVRKRRHDTSGAALKSIDLSLQYMERKI
jgi:hypothetical protein